MGPDRDLAKLDPTFRERVVALLRVLVAAGFDPMVWEGRRSFERADELQRRGSGVAKSMHCYGLAVDIVWGSAPHWDPPDGFWEALGAEAKRLGLTWGGDWKRDDKPHVQALPASRDVWVRNAKPQQIAQAVAEHLEHSDPSRRPLAPRPLPPHLSNPFAHVFPAPHPKDKP